MALFCIISIERCQENSRSAFFELLEITKPEVTQIEPAEVPVVPSPVPEVEPEVQPEVQPIEESIKEEVIIL